MDSIKLGTIGSGVIVHSVLDGVKATDGISLEAVYSRTEDKARTLADEYGAEKTYTDMDAFLADKDVNFVYIATPNLLHYEQTKKALLAGKNVICEKPFCTREDQAKELIDLAKEKRLLLVEAAPTSFLPNYEILKRELDRVGRVRLVIANYSQYSSRYDALLAGDVPNIFNTAYAGGCLMDINFYNVYLSVALFGRPQAATYYPNLFALPEGTVGTVCTAGGAQADDGTSAENAAQAAGTERTLGGARIDTSGVMLLQYDGFVSTLAGAKDTWGENAFQIEGEKGFIRVKDGSNGLREIRVVTKTSDETFNEQPNPDRWFYEVQRLTPLLLNEDYDAIYGRLQVTLDAVHVIESARKAAGILFPGDI